MTAFIDLRTIFLILSRSLKIKLAFPIVDINALITDATQKFLRAKTLFHAQVSRSETIAKKCEMVGNGFLLPTI